VIFFIAKRTFQYCAASFAKYAAHLRFLFFIFSLLAFSYKAGCNIMLCTVFSVFIGAINCINAHL